LEQESLPDRTFATARALVDELARRVPAHPELGSLRVAIMERHVERGEGRPALALLPVIETGPPAVADEARRVALLAMRQVSVPFPDEVRLYRARLRTLAPDGSRPEQAASEPSEMRYGGNDTSGEENPWARIPRTPEPPSYHAVLQEAISRLEERDRS